MISEPPPVAADAAVAPVSIEAHSSAVLGNVSAAAANRIALFIQERKGAQPAP